MDWRRTASVGGPDCVNLCRCENLNTVLSSSFLINSSPDLPKQSNNGDDEREEALNETTP